MMTRITHTQLFRLPAYLLFFLMLFLPTVYQPIKAVLVISVVAFILIGSYFSGTIKLHPHVVVITLGMSLVGIFFVIVGMSNGNEGALRVMPLFVLWPLLYLVFVMGCSNEAVLRGLIRVMVVSTIAICLYALLYVFYAARLIPSFLYFELDQGQNIAFYEGHIQFTFYFISSLLFLAPFLLTALFLWTNNTSPPVSRTWLWCAFVLSIVPIILTERKALWVIMLMAPFFALGIRQLFPENIKKDSGQIVKKAVIGIGVSILLLGLYLKIVYNYDFTTMVNTVVEGFNFNSGNSDDVIGRRNQYIALLQEWAATPFIGSGFGGVAAYTRSVEQPWSYELSYMALLFHTGILGFLLYGAGVCWIYVKSILIIRSGDRIGLLLAPILVGTTSFLIANATNPYLEKYDYLWVLFLPIGMINLWMLKQKRIPQEAVAHAVS